jgi:hypothetical protein
VRRQLSTWYFVADKGARGNVFSFHLEPTSHPLSLSNGLVAMTSESQFRRKKFDSGSSPKRLRNSLSSGAFSENVVADQNRPHFVVCFLSSRVIILRESGKDK